MLRRIAASAAVAGALACRLGLFVGYGLTRKPRGLAVGCGRQAGYTADWYRRILADPGRVMSEAPEWPAARIMACALCYEETSRAAPSRTSARECCLLRCTRRESEGVAPPTSAPGRAHPFPHLTGTAALDRAPSTRSTTRGCPIQTTPTAHGSCSGSRSVGHDRPLAFGGTPALAASFAASAKANRPKRITERPDRSSAASTEVQMARSATTLLLRVATSKYRAGAAAAGA